MGLIGELLFLIFLGIMLYIGVVLFLLLILYMAIYLRCFISLSDIIKEKFKMFTSNK